MLHTNTLTIITKSYRVGSTPPAPLHHRFRTKCNYVDHELNSILTMLHTNTLTINEII